MRTPLKSMYSRLKITPIGNNKWELLKSFTYYRGIKGSKNNITVPKGFIFDGASLPRVFYIVGTPMGTDTLIAALLHDYVYKIGLFSRNICDELFNEIMILTNVRTFKRVIYYLGVRIGGWLPYYNHKKIRQK